MSKYTVPTTGMRFILDAIPFHSDVSFDSILKHLLQMAEELCSRGNFCYVVTPSEVNGKKNTLALTDAMKGRAVILYTAPMTYGLSYRNQVADGPFYANVFGHHAKQRYAADFVLTLLGPHAQMIASTVALGYQYTPVPSLMFEPSAPLVADGENANHYYAKSNFLSMLHPTARALFLTSFEKDEYLGLAPEYGYSPHQIEHFSKISSTLGIPWGSEFLEVLKNPPPKFEKKTIFCGGRLFAEEKNLPKMAEVMSKLATELGCDAIVSTPNTTRSIDAHKMVVPHNVRFIDGCSRKEYLNLCARSHVFLNWSTSESYGMAIREAAGLGCVLLTVDTEANHQTYRGLGYEPWFFKDTVPDGLAAVRNALLNYDATHAAQSTLRKTTLDVGLSAVGHLNSVALQAIRERLTAMSAHGRDDEKMLFGSLSVDHWRNQKGKIPEQLFAYVNSKVGKSFNIWELVQALADAFDGNADTYLHSCTQYGLPTWPQLRNLLTHVYGLKDECTHRFPTFLPKEPVKW